MAKANERAGNEIRQLKNTAELILKDLDTDENASDTN